MDAQAAGVMMPGRVLFFVISWPPARRRPGRVPGVLGPVDNAAGGQLGAKTAIKIRGTQPSVRT